MGCWNATCGVTNLPIFSGQPVKSWGIVIRPVSEGESFIGGGYSYSHEMAVPLYLPVTGCYNDYGGVELTYSKESPENIFALRYLNQIRQKVVDGLNFIDLAKDHSLEEFYNEAIERSELFLDSPYGAPGLNKQSTCIYHVHKFVYNELMQKHLKSKSAYSRDKLTMEQKWTELADALIETVLTEGSSNLFQSSVFSTHPILYNLRESVYSFSGFLNSLLGDAALLEAYQEFVRISLVEFFAWNSIMGSLRLGWAPQSGAGSQDSDMTMHYCLNKAMAKQITQNRKYLEY